MARTPPQTAAAASATTLLSLITACSTYVSFSQKTQPRLKHPPRARQVVMTAGRPSGMAATASATAILR